MGQEDLTNEQRSYPLLVIFIFIFTAEKYRAAFQSIALANRDSILH